MNYDFSEFHKDCGELQIVGSCLGLHVYCPKCHVIADVEAVSGKVSPADACKVFAAGQNDRIIIGKQSLNVHRGGFKQP